MQEDDVENASSAKVFISHAHRDRDEVMQRIVSPLEMHDVPTWVDRSSIRAGDAWEQSIRQGLKSSSWFLVAISPHAVESRWVRAEVQWALNEREGRIIPAIIGPCDPAELNLLLLSLQYVDFVADAACALRQLLALWGRHVRDDEIGIHHDQNGPRTPFEAFETGKPFLGRYKVESRLGSGGGPGGGPGGFATVFKAHDLKLDRLMVLKAWRAETILPEQKTYLEREMRLQSRLRLAGVVGVHDFGPTWMVQDYMQGTSLQDLMNRNQLNARETTMLLAKTARILHRVHVHGIIHRDVKPMNILVDEYGDPHLVDFGLAKEISDSSADATLDSSYQMVGTPAYMAPEAVFNPSGVDGRTDLYALGVILYEMLAGKRASSRASNPFDALSLLSRTELTITADVQNVPQELVRVCNQCLRRNPDERFMTGEELARHLEACLQQPGWSIDSRR